MDISNQINDVVAQTQKWTSKDWSSPKKSLSKLVMEVNALMTKDPVEEIEAKKYHLKKIFDQIRSASKTHAYDDAITDSFYQIVALEAQKQKILEKQQKTVFNVESELALALLRAHPNNLDALGFVLKSVRKDTLGHFLPEVLKTWKNPDAVLTKASTLCDAYRLTTLVLEHLPLGKMTKILNKHQSWMKGHAKNTLSHSSLIRTTPERLNQIMGHPVISLQDMVVLHVDFANLKSGIPSDFFSLYAPTLAKRLLDANVQAQSIADFDFYEVHRLVNDWAGSSNQETIDILFGCLPVPVQEELSKKSLKGSLSNQSRLTSTYGALRKYLSEESKVEILKDTILSGRFALVEDLSNGIPKERLQEAVWEATQAYWQEKCPVLAISLDRRNWEQQFLANAEKTDEPPPARRKI